MFTETLKDLENLYRDVGRYDMSYDEFKYVENFGQRPMKYCVSIDLKREIKEDIVFIMKTKPRIQNARLIRSLLRSQ